jgi:hypothetical protein
MFLLLSRPSSFSALLACFCFDSLLYFDASCWIRETLSRFPRSFPDPWSSVLIRGEVLPFRSRRFRAITAIPAILFPVFNFGDFGNSGDFGNLFPVLPFRSPDHPIIGSPDHRITRSS